MEGNLIKLTDPLLKLKRGKRPSYKVLITVFLGFKFTSESEIENRSK